MNLGLHQTLQHAVDKGIEAYITSRRARIPLFIHQHFSFRGALALHRKTFGRDVYKYPVNLVWGVPVALVHGAADLLAKAGAPRPAHWLHRPVSAALRRRCRDVSVSPRQKTRSTDCQETRTDTPHLPCPPAAAH